MVTALRNYSKSQTSRRQGAPPPARAKPAKPAAGALRATAGGGVQKGGAARGAARRPTPAAAAPGSPRPLRVIVRREPSGAPGALLMQRAAAVSPRAAGQDGPGSTPLAPRCSILPALCVAITPAPSRAGESQGQPRSPVPPSSPPRRLKSFGGKVAPRPPPLLAAPADSCGPADATPGLAEEEVAPAAATVTCAGPAGPAGLSLHSARTTARLASMPSLRSGSPSPGTPLASAADLPAPVTPHASGGLDAGAVPAVIPGLARVVGLRGQPSGGSAVLERGPSDVGAALAAAGLAHAGSTAASAGAAAASCDAACRYLSELCALGSAAAAAGHAHSGVPRAPTPALVPAGSGDADMAEALPGVPEDTVRARLAGCGLRLQLC